MVLLLKTVSQKVIPPRMDISRVGLVQITSLRQPGDSDHRARLFLDALNALTLENYKSQAIKIIEMWKQVVADTDTWANREMWALTLSIFQTIQRAGATEVHEYVVLPIMQEMLTLMFDHPRGDLVLDNVPPRVELRKLNPILHGLFYGHSQSELAWLRSFYTQHCAVWHQLSNSKFMEYLLIKSNADTGVFKSSIADTRFVSAFVRNDCSQSNRLKLGQQLSRYYAGHSADSIPRFYADFIIRSEQ